jgi:ATP-dependent DNA ligase
LSDVTRSRAGRGRAEASALPEWAKPQLTKLVGTPPVGLEWLHAIKFDGYRTPARLVRVGVHSLRRTGLDWTQKYSATAVATMEVQKAYLDGESCGVSTDDIT